MGSWRVVTWNIRGAAGPPLGDIAAELTALRPDVVALQEVRRGQAAALAAALGWHHAWARKHHPATPLLWWLAEGLALLAPTPLESVVRRSIAPGVSTWSFRHRIVLAATVARGSERLRVYDTHLASGAAPDERILQARRVAELVRAEAPDAAVVAGDLNAPGEVEVVRELRAAGLRDPGGGPTHPAASPRLRLDHVLVPEVAHVTEQQEAAGGERWAALSDHVPVLVELALG